MFLQRPPSCDHLHRLQYQKLVRFGLRQSVSERQHKPARHSGQKLLVVLTGYPDPDNIASGLAHKLLAKPFEIETTLLCFHEVSHQENRVMVKRLEIDLQLYSEKFDLQPYSLYAFVDTQKVECPITDKLTGQNAALVCGPSQAPGGHHGGVCGYP